LQVSKAINRKFTNLSAFLTGIPFTKREKSAIVL